MSVLLEVGLLPGMPDAAGRAAARKIREHLGIAVEEVRTRLLYDITAPLSREESELAAVELFADPVIQRFAVDRPLEAEPFDLSIIVTFRPGVTDNVGRTAAAALREVLPRLAGLGDEELRVQTATQYLLRGVTRDQAERIARELLANDLIESTSLQEQGEWRTHGSRVPSAAVQAGHRPSIAEIDLEVEEAELARISRERVLALSLEEMRAVRDHFRDPRVTEARARLGLGPRPTDVELEALSQTWSEHCHHKIFNGIIEYTVPDGSRRTIRSLFRSYIRRVTEELSSPWLASVFADNAGVIRFN